MLIALCLLYVLYVPCRFDDVCIHVCIQSPQKLYIPQIYW